MRALKVINLAAGDRYFDGVDGSDLAPEHPGLATIDLREPLPYEDGSVDVALMSHALSNLSTQNVSFCPTGLWDYVFSEVYRVLKVGGWFRIDDAPLRFYLMEDADKFDQECGFAVRRNVLYDSLSAVGFGWILEMHPAETNIDCPPEIKAAVLGNKTWHLSFTLECRKVEHVKYADPGRKK